MTGRNTLWLPGTDRASIAVQTILEKQLKAEGKLDNDLGEKISGKPWEWKADRAILLLINCDVWAYSRLV
jgi:valyl-tRNA synthetase